MALNTRGSVDARWIYHNRGVALALHSADVTIYNEASSAQDYDPATNTWTGSKNVKWEGKARIQTTGGESNGGDVYNPTIFQGVRVQIAYGRNQLAGATDAMPDFRMNDRMVVTNSPYDANLEKFIFTVTGVLNSSSPWEKTLLCVVDTELDPTEV